MNTHGVKIFYRADNDAVVVFIPNNLHLVLFPADQRLVNQQLAGGRQLQSPETDFFKLIAVVGDTAAGATHRERGPDNAGKANFLVHCPGLFHTVGEPSTGRFKPDPTHRNVKFLAIFGFINGFLCGADHLHAKFFQDTL